MIPWPKYWGFEPSGPMKSAPMDGQLWSLKVDSKWKHAHNTVCYSWHTTYINVLSELTGSQLSLPDRTITENITRKNWKQKPLNEVELVWESSPEQKKTVCGVKDLWNRLVSNPEWKSEGTDGDKSDKLTENTDLTWERSQKYSVVHKNVPL